MKLQDVFVLLPVDSLEDLSLDQEPLAAESLLSAWTVPFHPAIVSSAGQAPRWQYVEHVVDCEEIAESLLLLPTPSEKLLPDGWIDRAESSGALVVTDLADRDAAVARILSRLDPLPEHLPFERLDADLVADLFALGFCRFQVELLTRAQYYMDGLDKDDFDDQTVRAARAIMRGDEKAAREDIQSAFDLLSEAREYFHSLDIHLLDLTLVATSTAGEALRDELAREIPTTLLISGRNVAALATGEPETLAAVKTALAEQRADLLGGEFGETALGLSTPETILAEIRRGLAAYEKHLGTRPRVFARRRFGLTPILPQILKDSGFVAACHFTLDRGTFPTDNQSKILWEGAGGASLESLGRVPIDASRAESFLQLPEQLAGGADLDDAPTVVFAHWPGRWSCWYDALRRMHRYGPALGQFVGMNAYFEETADVGQAVFHGPDEYRSPYLAESVEKGQPDPISRWVRYHARQATVEAIGALRCMARVIPDASPGWAGCLGHSEALAQTIEDRAFAALIPGHPVPPEEEALDERLQTALGEAAGLIADALPRRDGAAAAGRLCLNPCSFARTYETARGHVDPSGADVPATVEVPAMGFAWTGPEAAPEDTPSEAPRAKPFWRRKRVQRPPLLAEENVLRNEFFEATIDPTTGALRAIHDFRTRGNRLAVQLALRGPEPAAESDGSDLPKENSTVYSIMAAERIEVENAGRGEGRITCHGRLVDHHGNRLAGFRQTLRVRRGSRILELDVELMPEHEPGRRPWDSYYAVRFAWDDPTAELLRSVNMMSWPTEALRFEAPHFVEVRGEKRRTTILTGGLPYHRRFGLRKMDTLLIVRGETARRFRLGIGIDLPHPIRAAVDFLAPRVIHVERARPPKNTSGWLFHVDAANVTATGWEPLPRDGRPAGFRVRLLETEGSATRLRLRSFRPPAVARQTDFLGNARRELKTENDCVFVHLEAHQWTQVEVHWDKPESAEIPKSLTPNP